MNAPVCRPTRPMSSSTNSARLGNHLVHYYATGAALERVFRAMADTNPGLRLRAFTSATGSAGTIAAGDYLKERFGSKVVAVEALECPTMLYNGFGEHNIQGIGDKHIPLIHNIMNVGIPRCRVGPRHRPAGNTVQHRRGARLLASRRGVDAASLGRCPRSGSRASATCSQPSRPRSTSATVPTTPS